MARYTVGLDVEYYSTSFGAWIATYVQQVGPHGEVELARKPGYLMPLDEQDRCLRLPPKRGISGAEDAQTCANRVSAETAGACAKGLHVRTVTSCPAEVGSDVESGISDLRAQQGPPAVNADVAPRASLQRKRSRGVDSWDAGEVVPGLFVGSLSAAQSEDCLLEKSIVCVITVAARIAPALAWTSLATSQRVTTYQAEVEDTPCADILEVLPSVIRRIDRVMKARKADDSSAALVHCASGVSRSVAACMSWLIIRRQLTVDDALRTVQANRPHASPNFGFIQALRLLEGSGGKLDVAHSRWLKANKEYKRDGVVSSFRKVADELNIRGNALEERYWQEKRGSGVVSEELRILLEQLLQDVDKAEPQRVIDDSTARSVRQATADKANRLLGRASGRTCVSRPSNAQANIGSNQARKDSCAGVGNASLRTEAAFTFLANYSVPAESEREMPAVPFSRQLSPGLQMYDIAH